MSKFPEISVRSQMETSVSVRSDQIIREKLMFENARDNHVRFHCK